MFKHRLGALLGKSLEEVDQLSAPEYRSWWWYYQIEPWGWEDQEYRTASLMTMLANGFSGKKAKFADYFRDIQKEIMKQIARKKAIPLEQEKLLEMSPEERRRYIARQIGAVTKLPVVVKDGNSSNDHSKTSS